MQRAVVKHDLAKLSYWQCFTTLKIEPFTYENQMTQQLQRKIFQS